MTKTQATKPAGRAERLYRYFGRIFAFVLLLLVLFFGLNSFLQPVWYYENNYHTYRSFYKEPSNTIETIFVGASMTLFGLSPMEMYNQNGICAYNLASTSQPLMMSYYWVKEAKSLHSETLDTVVLDVSMLRRTPKEEDYRKALDGMQWGPVKNEAIDDLSDTVFEQLTYRYPIFGYHDRWSQLNYTDFFKYDDSHLEYYARGYYMEFNRIFDEFHIEEIGIPTQVVDPAAAPAGLQTESLYYLNKLIEFCEEQSIKLVLCKTPSPINWSSSEHNAIQQIADAYDITFLDFEVDPLLTDIGYCPPLDSKDLNKHLNYYGAMKLTRYMSTYLAEQCGNRDVRGDAKYQYLEDQLERYNGKVTLMANATLTDNVADYLSYAAQADNYTILITVKGEATANLSAEQRIVLDRLGLTDLSTLRANDSYLAVMTDGEVEYQAIDRNKTNFDDQVEHNIDALEKNEAAAEEAAADEGAAGEEAAEEGAAPGKEEIGLDDIDLGEWEDDEETRVPLTYSGRFEDGNKYTLTSLGADSGSIGSCLITIDGEQKECAKNARGINLVVYDNDVHRVVHATSFDTHIGEKRETPALETLLTQRRYRRENYARLSANLKKLYRYRRRMEYSSEAKTLRLSIGAGGLLKYLKTYAREGLIVLVSVRGDATRSLSAEARQALVDMGLTGVGDLGYQGSYCAAVEDGVVSEQIVANDNVEPVTLVRKWYTIKSAGTTSGDLSSIIIDDNGYSADYSPNLYGFNIVVYNPRLDIVIDRTSYNTNAVAVDLY